MTYAVKNWDRHYENNRSRILKRMEWVPVSNKHDGETFSRIMAHKRGAEIFSAWNLIIQIASKCAKRGVLIRDSGKPYDAESLALKTRGQVSWFEIALPYLVENGWLEVIDNEQHGTSLVLSGTDPAPSDQKVLANGMEGKGIEPPIVPQRGPVRAKIHEGVLEAIYAAYPRHVAPSDAHKAIRKAIDAGNSPELLLAAAQNYAQAVASWSAEDRGYIPHPATWFNRGSYRETPADWVRKPKTNGYGAQDSHASDLADSAVARAQRDAATLL